MTATDKTSCISHRQNNRFFVIYEDFLDVAKVSEHQYKLAAFWRVLETKTNERILFNEEKKIPNTEENQWIEVPYSEFVSRSLGVYKVSAFQVAAAESERLGFTKSRVLKRPIRKDDPDSPLEEYKEYLLLTHVLQSVLNGGEYPTPVENNSRLLESMAIRKAKRASENNIPPVENNTTPLLETTGDQAQTGIENNRKKYNKVSSKYKNNKEDSPASVSSPPPSATPHGSAPVSLLGSSVESSGGQEDLQEQQEEDVRIASTTPSTPPLSQERPKRTTRKKPQEEVPAGPPVMPDLGARWNAETMVQIVEAKKGSPYSPTTRKQEKEEANKILTAIRYQNQPISRDLFERAWDDMCTWSWWTEKGLEPMIRHLRKDDKIRTILKKIEGRIPSPSKVLQFPKPVDAPEKFDATRYSRDEEEELKECLTRLNAR